MAEIKTKNLSKCECKIYDVDNRIRIEDGRFYTTRTPYENGKQSDFPELVDVTEDVLNVLLKAWSRQIAADRQAAIVEQLKNGHGM